MDDFVSKLFENYGHDMHSETIATADYSWINMIPRSDADMDRTEKITMNKVKKAIENSALFEGEMFDQTERLLEFFDTCNRFARSSVASIEAILCEEAPFFVVNICSDFFSLDTDRLRTLQSIIGDSKEILIFSVPQKNNGCLISVNFNLGNEK